MSDGIGRQLANHLFDMKEALQDAPIGLAAAGVYLEHHKQALDLCEELLRREMEDEIAGVSSRHYVSW